MSSSSSWKEVYLAAILEDDRNNVPLRIASAEAVICHRLDELRLGEARSSAGQRQEQRQELERVQNAMRMLELLRRTEEPMHAMSA